ncbi:hypothetical protein IE81DRAFT_93638 [Ceraceosorus guamensis]|uniref:Uncharacterized protein n=1 Tax=Ceraceosorus guamensis TaxID=1522189 RepID=A0A316W2F3_9BASI|nr:hypothetical protein IE81DRAFT_93638 [Ceraceosorus guamensis]PWN43268.1 hypothetical protein IE81DRAFT_93638 [Ceraceosorus guamensis]
MKLTAASAPAVAAALALAASQPINGQPAVHDSVFVTSADVSSSAVAGVDKPRSTVTLTVTAEATKPTSTGSIQAANKAKQEANSTTTVTASVMVIAPSSTASEEPAKTNKPADFAAGSRRSTAKSKRHTLNRADGASGMVRVRRSASASSSSSSAQQSLADTSSLIKDVRPSARASAGVLRRVWLALRAADEAQDVAAPENHGHTSEHVHSYDYEREHERHGGHRYGYETPYTTVTTTRTRTHTYWQQAKPTSRPAAAKMQPPANDAAPEADSPDAPADDDSTAEDLRKRLVTVHSHVDNVASSDTQAEVDADADDGAFVSDADTEDGLHINFLSANDQDNDLQNEEFVTRADESEEDDCDADADDFDELEGQDRVFRRAESSQAQLPITAMPPLRL